MVLSLCQRRTSTVGRCWNRFTLCCFAVSFLASNRVIFCSGLSAMPPPIKLTYFDIEGVAESIRLALLLSNTEFDDIRVAFPEWKDMKETMPYGQLPVMSFDNGPLRAHSKGLLRYVGSTYSKTLYPPEKLLAIEEAIGVVEDLQLSLRPTMATQKEGFPEGFYQTEEGKNVIKALREKFVSESIPKYMNFLIRLLEKNEGQWLASVNSPTIADCLAVPTLRSFTRGKLDFIPPTCLDTYPEIVAYIKRFCSLEPIGGRYTDGIY